jgi:transposase-like protein
VREGGGEGKDFLFVFILILIFITNAGEVREIPGPPERGISDNEVSDKKRYTAEFKEQAVELVRVGRPVREVAMELEVGVSLLYAWVYKSSQPAQLGPRRGPSRRRGARSGRAAQVAS